MNPLLLIVTCMIVAVAGVRVHWRLRERLKTVEGWRQKWERTVKWVTFDGATTFDHAILWAVLTGRLAKSTAADIRRDARILRVLILLSFLGAVALVSSSGPSA